MDAPVIATGSELVSICIPTYNGADHLRDCLDSAISQLHPNLEVLVVDDCSADSTLEIAASYASLDARIRIIRNDRNLGLVGNWNRCVEIAEGTWIKFLFQDDMIAPNCVGTMLAAAEHPLVVCQRDFLFAPDSSPQVVADYNALPNLATIFRDQTSIDAKSICEMVLTERRNVFGEPTSTLLHRSVFQRFGGFNENLRQLCDLEYWLRVGTNTGITSLNEKMATFRYHGASMSASNRDVSRDAMVSVFDELVILHEFAHSPHYAQLRAHGQTKGQASAFEYDFDTKRRWVAAKARARTADATAPDPSWANELSRLSSIFPKISPRKENLGNGVRSLFDKYLGWRAKR